LEDRNRVTEVYFCQPKVNHPNFARQLTDECFNGGQDNKQDIFMDQKN
jgi:hypothetical protein